MYISRIVIRNFRNFQKLDVALGSGVTCIIGENNTGKTNLLYAVRLVIDGNLSNYRRRLLPEDFWSGVSYHEPQQVLISLEFADFTDDAIQEAMVFDARSDLSKARLTYRFRPTRSVREALANEEELTPLALEDYRWELRGGGQEDPGTLEWNEESGHVVRIDDLSQTYSVVTLDALRDAAHMISTSRRSPLRQLLTQEDVPEEEQEELVTVLRNANSEIADSATIRSVGTDIENSLSETAGEAFSMAIKLGMEAATFEDVSRGLSLLLTNDALVDFSPRLNGTGMNNVIYASMLLRYFNRRIDEGKTAGQVLLFEEPEAHLHPQLERILFRTLSDRGFQVFMTTHSSHISSQAPLNSLIVLTNTGGSTTSARSLVASASLTGSEVRDVERYLDATRSVLLYARGVMLVEGPAEMFVIPALVKKVLDIDLDRYGISVIPIYGVHFETYAKLFGPSGLPTRCAIVADGDLEPSYAASSDHAEDQGQASSRLKGLQNDYVRVFVCETTFERALTVRGTLAMLAQACDDLGAGVVAGNLRQTLSVIGSPGGDDASAIGEARTRVLNTAKRFGKARFAQVAARHVALATSVPRYIEKAVEWLVS